ncbi:MAG: glutathione S-transferase [Pseudomonadota bacterium]|jgi:glutathione S-transferase
MKLLISLTSPYARKVRIVMAEKRIDCETVVDAPWSEGTHVPEYNPLGKVPVLVMDDDSTLFDSRVIIEYLDTATPVSRLIPKDTRKRVHVKRWEALADGVCDAAAAVVLEKRRPAAQQSAEWIVRQERKIFAGLEAMSEELGENKWCTGDFYTLADIAVGCALGYLDFRFPAIKWREAHPNLDRLAGKLAERPAFRDTVPHD